MTSLSSKITPKKVLQYVLLLVIAILLIYYSFKDINWEEFWAGLAGCNWWWIILSMIVGGLEFLLRALRWNLILRQIHSNNKILNEYRGITIGNLSNFAIPRIGEIVRCSVVADTDKVPFEKALGSVVAERSWDLICLFLLTIYIFFSQNEFGNFIRRHIFNSENSFLSNTYLWIAAVVLILVGSMVAWFIAKNQSAFTKKIKEKITATLSRLKDGFLAIFKMRQKWLFLSYTILLWISYLLTSYMTILAFDQLHSLNINDALFLMIVGALGWAVPVQAGIGSYHFIVSLALMQLYSLSQSESLAFATISHSSQAIVMIILGVISVVLYTVNKRKILREKE